MKTLKTSPKTLKSLISFRPTVTISMVVSYYGDEYVRSNAYVGSEDLDYAADWIFKAATREDPGILLNVAEDPIAWFKQRSYISCEH